MKQAARVWNQTLHGALIKYGCVQSQNDQCLYILREGDKVCYLEVHVDDILTATNKEEFSNHLMTNVGKEFELKDLGIVKHYLGIDVTKDMNGNFLIGQPKFIDKIVTEAGLEDAKSSKFPVDTGYYKIKDEILLESNDEYRKLIGMLLYLTTNSRPDIAASVSMLSQKVSTPTRTDLNEVKRLIRYLKGTRNMKLSMSDQGKEEKLHAYSDANWAEDQKDRKSNSGFFCSINGGALSWSCRKQGLVTLSSTEAEYVALSETCKEIVWLKRLAKDVCIGKDEPIKIYTDSQSSMKMIENGGSSNRTKHIDTKHHYIKNMNDEKEIFLEYCQTDENIADMMTKPLGGTKIEKLRLMAGVKGFAVEEGC